jgi:hypothetical protein
MRRSEPRSIDTSYTDDHPDHSNTEGDTSSGRLSDLQGTEALLLEAHYTTNINLGWQKLDYYYNKTDITPVHRVVVFLHLRLKWRWFEKY